MPRKHARPAARARRVKLKENLRTRQDAMKQLVKRQNGTLSGLGLTALIASIFRRDQ